MIARIVMIALAGLLLGFTPNSARAQETAKLEVILVMASNSGEGIDPSLQPYAKTLQRLFRFNSYQQRDKKSLSISVPGGQAANLYGGTQLKVGLQAIADEMLPVNLDWKRGRDTLLKTLIRLNPNTPAIVGGPQADNNTGSYLMIVTWRQ